ncbi:ATP-dependent bile acid permease [Auricularia subglabra TFB-10046 SS5]|uniref:ATP-dependent bile acid permease n=1 Tax=Auricularia subglabra (strain TFB-10046 / SS5) TaxID=717982 RepID=J0DDV6_AURST|nr:ATP-dependent bile acid permease [Auricularia subglabra TFB-10046 SS5]
MSWLKRIFHPPAAPAGFGKGVESPDARANVLSLLTFAWLGPMLSVGWTRPLAEDDLWEMDAKRQARTVADTVETLFYDRCPPFKRPQHLRPPTLRTARPAMPTSPTDEKAFSVPPAALENVETTPAGTVAPSPLPAEKDLGPEVLETQQHAKKWDMSLLWTLNKAFFWRIWTSGLLKLCGDTLNTTTPLITKLLIQYITTAYIFHRAPAGTVPAPRAPGYGIALAFGIFLMQETSSLCNNQYFFRTMTLGFLVRTSLVSAIFRKSLRLSGRARLQHSTGQITTMISADCSRLDMASGFFHTVWIAPIQITVGIALLIVNLGVSALVGLAVLCVSLPLQAIMIRRMVAARRRSVKMTDKRVRLLHEVLQGIRLLVLFSWQSHYAERLVGMRRAELQNIRRLAYIRAILTATTTFIPVLCAILSFITYALLGHTLDPATIFSSLQFFNIIRAPLLFFPMVASACSDGYVSLGRISRMLLAEEMEDAYDITLPSASSSDDDVALTKKPKPLAVSMHGSFTWERGGAANNGPNLHAKFGFGRPGGGDEKAKKMTKAERKAAAQKEKEKAVDQKKKAKEEEEAYKKRFEQWKHGIPAEEDGAFEKGPEPFRLANVDFDVRSGSFVAIVGRVGSGKSSLLQALAGDMRRISGDVHFGGTVAYAPQAPWIQNLNLRDNITFGQAFEEDRFREVIRACALEPDLAILPDGEFTEIGERGVNLSGGQKARINLARVAYHRSDIALIDDPLSAVDAHVAKHILQNCLLAGPLAEKTRILVTHQLYVLPYVDEVVLMDEGKIVERGTYAELLARGGSFADLIEEFGTDERKMEAQDLDKTSAGIKEKIQGEKSSAELRPTGAGAKKLVEGDERETGAVSWSAYYSYLQAAGGIKWAPGLLVWLALAQCAQVASNVFLGFWTDLGIPGFSTGQYMGVYAGLGAATALFTFIGSLAFAITGFNASLSLFTAALRGVMGAPLRWHERTPTGAITNRLSKDIDTLDMMLPQAWFQLLTNLASIFGTVALVFYAYAWLGISMSPHLVVVYFFFSMFYRRTSIEVKRLDSILRSLLYASFSEALTGLGTIRAYKEEPRFVRDSETKLDSENRVCTSMLASQRWLGVRLDLLGNVLVLGIGLIAVGFRNTTNPSKMGVVMTYSLTITQVMSQMVTMLAQVEQNMNTVERIVVYCDLESEPPAKTDADPKGDWPPHGGIVFKGVDFRYRDDLPLALKGISFEIRPGERIGIVGRTGAGKSSILTALFRTGPLAGGQILIDGVDIDTIGLEKLRMSLSIIPQDALGTLRANIDPLGRRSDVELHAALKRVGLINPPPAAGAESSGPGKFDLDREVRDDSFSAGEKQLLALCRALVKSESKVLVLDEATSSVDVATDATIQMMIQQDFKDRTLLCIAHRLNTIVYYDRVLVMNEGQVAEYDTPLNLFDQGGIFRSMCDQASLAREDIVRIRTAAGVEDR